MPSFTPTFAPGEEINAYRRWRAGKTISEQHEQHFAALTPNELGQLEQMAEMHDEQDEKVRKEIAEHPEGYAWHKGPGGGLPFGWSDSELPRLRPRDWRQAEAIQFVSASSPRRRKARPLARRRGAGRPRAQASRSSGRSGDSGESNDSDGESSDDDAARLRGFLVYLIGFDWSSELIDSAYALSVDIEREVSS